MVAAEANTGPGGALYKINPGGGGDPRWSTHGPAPPDDCCRPMGLQHPPESRCVESGAKAIKSGNLWPWVEGSKGVFFDYTTITINDAESLSQNARTH